MKTRHWFYVLAALILFAFSARVLAQELELSDITVEQAYKSVSEQDELAGFYVGLIGGTMEGAMLSAADRYKLLAPNDNLDVIYKRIRKACYVPPGTLLGAIYRQEGTHRLSIVAMTHYIMVKKCSPQEINS